MVHTCDEHVLKFVIFMISVIEVSFFRYSSVGGGGGVERWTFDRDQADTRGVNYSARKNEIWVGIFL